MVDRSYFTFPVMTMKAVILTAGEGLRIRPLTNSMPKGMIPIANRPILEHIVEALKGVGIPDIVMVVGHKKERVLSHFGDGRDFGVRIDFVEQKRQLGTAHALRKARDLLDGDFLVLPGDNYVEEGTLRRLFENGGKPPQVVITESRSPSKYGMVSVKGGIIRDIAISAGADEDRSRRSIRGIQGILTHTVRDRPIRSDSDFVFTCICHLGREIFGEMDGMSGKERNNMTDIIRHMLGRNADIGAVKTDIWLDAVYPWDLLFLNDLALERLRGSDEGKIEEGSHLSGEISLGKGTVIHSNCYIRGPVIIGEGCEIGPNACIFPSTSIGDNVTVDTFCKVGNSIIMDDVSIGAGALIEDSILAAGARCGANVSIRTSEIKVGGDEKMGRTHGCGSVVGEDSVLGHGAVIDGGTVIGSNCAIASLARVRENIPDGSRLLR